MYSYLWEGFQRVGNNREWPTTLLDSRIMAEVVEAQEGDFELDVARAIVRLHFSDAQNEQMRELANKNNRGELTEEERDKLESYRRVGNFLALLQSKARLSLKQAGSGSDKGPPMDPGLRGFVRNRAFRLCE